MAHPFDSLFAVPQSPPRKAKRDALVVEGVCQQCKTLGVFWTLAPGPYILCEMVDGWIVRHHHRALDDFEDIS